MNYSLYALFGGFDADLDVGVEQAYVSQFDGPREQFVLCVDCALWGTVMKTKNLQPELLRWYLQLKKFEFVVQDKANVHTPSDPDQA